MTNQFVGEIRVFGFNFAPVNWALCHGQLVAISQNTALFSILGTTYGGDGVSTFGLPNLQDRLATHVGQGPDLSNWVLGEIQGETSHTLTINEVPTHTHQAVGADGVAFAGQLAAPAANAYYGRERGGAYANSANSTLHPSAIGFAGGSQPHSNTMPTLGMNYNIALFGIFPSRN
jgi:microcystin-dependent protein